MKKLFSAIISVAMVASIISSVTVGARTPSLPSEENVEYYFHNSVYDVEDVHIQLFFGNEDYGHFDEPELNSPSDTEKGEIEYIDLYLAFQNTDPASYREIYLHRTGGFYTSARYSVWKAPIYGDNGSTDKTVTVYNHSEEVIIPSQVFSDEYGYFRLLGFAKYELLDEAMRYLYCEQIYYHREGDRVRLSRTRFPNSNL